MSSMKEIWTAFKAASSALPMPVRFIGGIWSGIFAPSGGHCRCLWADNFNLCIPRYRLKGCPPLLLKALQTSATVICAIGATVAFPGF